MKNFRNSGQEVTHTATADRKSGDPVVIGSMIGICACDVLNGGQVSADVEGVFEMKKTAALAIAQGDKVYLNTTTRLITKTNSDAPAGIASKAAIGADTVVEVKLIPGMTA